MPVDGPVPWPLAEHTAAKHDIYRTYLAKWFPILLAKKKKPFPSVTYVEGFAGPGIYVGGQPGSPILAIRALVNEVPPDRGVAKFVFVDDDPRCIELLRQQLRSAFTARPRSLESMLVEIQCGTCANKLESSLDKLQAWDKPIFAVFDSWGNVPVPYQLFQRLAANIATEVIVTFLPQHFVRFVSQMSDEVDNVFGGDPGWRDILKMVDPDAKRRHLLTAYREMLGRAGFDYLLDFELIDRRGQSMYLIFATNHPLGVAKMKESLWTVDPVFGVGFRDPRDVLQESLFEPDNAQLAPLGRLLASRLARTGRLRVEDLRTFALLGTIFRPEHVISALQVLKESGQLIVEGGGRLQRSSFVSTAPRRGGLL